MNLFRLDDNPIAAAQQNCDKHVLKIIIESCQMLSNCFHTNNLEGPYKPTHIHHPMSRWVRTTEGFNWTLEHALALCNEYTFRYGKTHATQSKLEWIDQNRRKLDFDPPTPFPLCMPNDYKLSDAVSSYRNYYLRDKSRFAKWTRREKPSWYYL